MSFKMTKEDIERVRQENPELEKKLKPKRITGNTRNAALRELLRTTAKVTKAEFDKSQNS